ncbi:MAG: adenylate/guanylate cyclase domain-containing protein [Pseudomonadota bacterium]
MSERVERKLTTILSADAEGYSRAMAEDEESALAELRAARSVFSRLIDRHRGRIANTAGDGLIAEFASVVEAVQCAIEVQQELGANGRDALRYRIGIHLGDVMVDGEDLLGEGVNLAARLQTMAEPGGVLISQQVYDQVHAKLSVGFDYLGEQRPKNFTEDVPIYRITYGQKTAQPRVAVDPSKSPRHEARDTRPLSESRSDPDTRNGNAIRTGRVTGLVLLGLAVVDLSTGAGFWWHWVALVAGTAWALISAPVLAPSNCPIPLVRGAIVVTALALCNLFSWSGTAWFLWPAGVLAFIMLARHAVRSSD